MYFSEPFASSGEYLSPASALGGCGCGPAVRYAGFAEPSASIADAKTALEILAKIRAQLNRNMRADDEPGILDRRRRLRVLFNSVPKLFAPSLSSRLTDNNDELGKLFHYRLATPTRNEMLNILLNKSSEPI